MCGHGAGQLARPPEARAGAQPQLGRPTATQSASRSQAPLPALARAAERVGGIKLHPTGPRAPQHPPPTRGGRTTTPSDTVPQHFHQHTFRSKHAVYVVQNSRILAILYGFNPRATKSMGEICRHTSPLLINCANS